MDPVLMSEQRGGIRTNLGPDSEPALDLIPLLLGDKGALAKALKKKTKKKRQNNFFLIAVLQTKSRLMAWSRVRVLCLGLCRPAAAARVLALRSAP